MTSIPFSFVLFDLDGTLVDTAPDLTGALNHVLSLNGYDPVSVDQMREFVGHGARVTIERGFAHYGVNIKGDALNRAHQQFLDFYSENIAETSVLYSGVKEVLEQFKAQGIGMGVCTNKSEDLSIKLLTQLGVADDFQTICGSDTVPNRKPHPDHIITAINRAGGNRFKAIMIGDSQADVDSAKAAGLPVIAMSYGYTAVPSDQLGANVVLDSFAELPAVLANWSA